MLANALGFPRFDGSSFHDVYRVPLLACLLLRLHSFFHLFLLYIKS